MLHGQHHRSGLILQIFSLQHPRDPALPHEGKQRNAWSKCLSSPALTTATRSWLDSLQPAIKPLQRIQNAAAHLVFNLPKFSHVTPLFRDLHWLPVLASHQIQDNGTGLQGCQRNCPYLPPSVSQTPRPSSSAPLNYLSWPAGTAIAKSKQRSHSKVTTLLCFWHRNSGTSSLPMSASTCQDCRVALHSILLGGPPPHHVQKLE